MGMISLGSLRDMKQRGEKIAMLTSYDATFAHACSQAGVDMLLIGDSLGMVLQGHSSTLPVSMDDMVYHTACVARGARGPLIMADLPFMANATLDDTLRNAGRLMAAGAQMIKIEGDAWLAPYITRLAELGVPVCAHLGLTPQAVNLFGGYKVQGRGEQAAARLLEAARALERAGAACLLLECVPSPLAAQITRDAAVPVIGIGAGADTDGQVLVLHDALGLSLSGRSARFVKNFLAGRDSIDAALRAYVGAVKDASFPSPEQAYSA